MGRGSILTKGQELILGEFKKDDWLSSLFYFTGGTALSEFYLQHRLSDDLDFFTQEAFDGLQHSHPGLSVYQAGGGKD